MSSSNSNQSQNYGCSSQPSPYSFGGYSVNPGSTIVNPHGTSPGNLSIVPSATGGMTLASVGDEPQIYFIETAGGTKVKATLEPDASLTACELLKIVSLITTMREPAIACQINPVSFLRRHSLERHFRFEQV